MRTTVDIPESLVEEKVAKELKQLRAKVIRLERKLSERDANAHYVEKFKECMRRVKDIAEDYDFWD